MIKALKFGRYISRDSAIHRLDPRIKFLVLIFFILVLLMTKSTAGLVCITAVIFLHLRASRLSAGEVGDSLRPLLPVLIFAFLINFFVVAAGENILFSFWFFRVSAESARRAINMTLRVASLVLISNLLLTLTTSAMEITDALSSLLSPLRHLGVPVQDIAMMMSVALRFVPTLIEETDKIMKAQASRGADYDTGGPYKRAKGFVTVLIPLFISAFRRAEALAAAMEARAYRSDVRRGKLHPLKMRMSDIVYAIGISSLLLLITILDRMGILYFI